MTTQWLVEEFAKCDELKKTRSARMNGGNDNKISWLCVRGVHANSNNKHVCKGRTCTCNCHKEKK